MRKSVGGYPCSQSLRTLVRSNNGSEKRHSDPSDYMDVLGSSNLWTTFSNLSVLMNTSIAFPDPSAGVGAAHAFTDQWIVKSAINDANGVIDKVTVFKDGPE